ncbi:MAG: Gfo/Idh/MocA family oxidoreductase [Phycisphaeraceae bacterium]
MSAAVEPIRIGVVGHRFGQHHVRTLASLPDVRLVAVADRRGEGLDAAAAQYHFTPYRDAGEMLEREPLDAVSICISPKLRRALLAAAVDKGLALFIEKPWASNAAHARELAEVVRPSRAPVMAGFSFRFHPAIVKLKGLLDGELGQPRMLAGQYAFGWLPAAGGWAWEPDNGNGFINENSCHLFDAVCYLMGKPVRVFAEGGLFTGRAMEDAATITLRFESGAIAALTCGGVGASAFVDFPRIDLFAEHGQARLQGRQHMWESLAWARHDAPATSQIMAPPEQLGATRYTHAFKHFCQCIRDGAAPSASVDDAVRSVDVAMAVVESARTRQPVCL